MNTAVTKPTPKLPNRPQRRFVQQNTWFISRDGKRAFALVDKTGRFNEEGVYSTTQVTLLEYLKHVPIFLGIDEFWGMIDDGRLVEYIDTIRPVAL